MSQLIPQQVVKLTSKSELAKFITEQKLESGDLSSLFIAVESDLVLGIVGPDSHRYFVSFKTGTFHFSSGTSASSIVGMCDVHTWLPQVIKDYGPNLVELYNSSPVGFIEYCENVLGNDLSLYDLSEITHLPIPHVYQVISGATTSNNDLIATDPIALMLYSIYVTKRPNKLFEHIIFDSWEFSGAATYRNLVAGLVVKYMRLYTSSDSLSVVMKYPVAVAVYAMRIRKARWQHCEETMFSGVTANTLLPVLMYCNEYLVHDQRVADLVQQSGIEFYRNLYKKVSATLPCNTV